MRNLKSTILAGSFLLCAASISTQEAYAFDFIKKIIDPVDYWEEQVAKDEKMLDFYRNQVVSCRLEFEKLKQTKEIIFRQNILDGMTPEEARDDFLAEWEANKIACETMTELYDMENLNLNKTKAKLQKAQNGQ